MSAQMREALKCLLALHDNRVDTADAWNKTMEEARAALAHLDQIPGYVQAVPDECDRVYWRGRYYPLPQPEQRGEVVAVPAVILEIGRRLLADRKQNDHWTRDPIYTVQREDRVYRIEHGEGDGSIWIEYSEQCDQAKADRLERRRQRGWELPQRFERVEYRTRWQFVDAFLSYEAAKDCAEAMNRKRNGTYRTFVESGYRNHEWQAMQSYFMALAAAPEVKP